MCGRRASAWTSRRSSPSSTRRRSTSPRTGGDRRVWRFFGLETVAEEPSGAPNSEEALADAGTRGRVRAAIDALPERLREVLVLTEYGELSYDEIAATLGIPPGTVGSRRSQAMARLTEALGPIEAP
jgi:RNA polymerase sigma-70 factor (ECF subfamily)